MTFIFLFSTKRMKTKALWISLLLSLSLACFGREPLVVSQDKLSNIGQSFTVAHSERCEEEIPAEQSFRDETARVPLYDGNTGCYWLRFEVENQTQRDKLLLEIYNSSIDLVELQLYQNGELLQQERQGRSVEHHLWQFRLPNILFELDIASGEDALVYLRVRNAEQFSVPVNLGTKDSILANSYRDQILFGIYAGIMLALFFYNLFVYFTVRDRSYFWYIAHTLLVLLTQSAAAGFAFLYLWPETIWLAQNAFVIFTCLVTLAGIRFFFEFLKVKDFEPGFYRFFRVLELVYALIILLQLIGLRNLAYQILFPMQGTVSILIFIVSLRILVKGYRPAKIYVLAWSILLLGVIIYALKDFSILPYNYLTVNTIQIGSAMEAILLSIALADKINILKKEKDASQEEALQMAKENERIIREQNVELEKRVQERTMALQEANEELQVTLDNLKDTQTQLVDAEKMASLGQLTAGIAHEINNPINFITSNINPLKLDIDEIYQIVDRFAALSEACPPEELKAAQDLMEELDYQFLKEEINTLVGGISDGANRTSEIVRGLRTFSRLDEDVVKPASLNEGLDSTLVLLKNKTKDRIEVVREYDEGLPEIECYPGKLNQAFMNILNNGIYAVNAKDHYPEGVKPTITLRTEFNPNNSKEILIHLKDNGIGMDEETQKKMFDPFFTTKEVGEGTGLGMSIVFKIVDKHGGRLDVNSELGKGTEFIIALPLQQPTEFS